MHSPLEHVGRVEVLQVSGLLDEGWCEPHVRLTAKALAPVARLQLRIWLKPEKHWSTPRALRVATNGVDQMVTALPADVPVVALVACRAGEGETLTVEIDCDNEVIDKGRDERRLGFVLSELSFS